MDLKKIRKKIQKTRNFRFPELEKFIEIGKNSIFRVENEDKFLASVYVRYLIFLRRNDIDVNAILDEHIANKNKE